MIRSAVAADASWITDLWNAVISDTLITFTTVPKSESQIVEMIETRPVLVQGRAGGFATYGPFRPGPGYAATVEHTVIMAPDTRGQGLGRQLMTALLDTARADGKHVMVAGVSGANPAAIAFHAALGFEQVARMPQVGHKAGHWLDLVLMQKMLNPPDTGTDTG